MEIKSLKRVLPVMLKHRIVPFIWGKQGIGKTQTIKQFAKENDLNFVHLHVATQEPGDLVGLLIRNDDGTVKHARPEWFPTEGQGIIFLDELNRAHPDCIQALFSFITEGTIHTHRLPSGYRIVAAGNYNSEEFTVTDTSDAAWMSRFCHINLEPSIDEFILYAASQKADSVADFISEHRELLETKATKYDVAVTPDRRSWLSMIAPLETEELTDVDRYELYAGIIGSAASSTFISFKKNNMGRLKLSDILSSYHKKSVKDKVKKLVDKQDTRFDMLSTPLDELVDLLTAKADTFSTSEQVKNLQAFLLDVPLELMSQFVKKIGKLQFDRKNELLSSKEFIQSLRKKEKK